MTAPTDVDLQRLARAVGDRLMARPGPRHGRVLYRRLDRQGVHGRGRQLAMVSRWGGCLLKPPQGRVPRRAGGSAGAARCVSEQVVRAMAAGALTRTAARWHCRERRGRTGRRHGRQARRDGLAGLGLARTGRFVANRKLAVNCTRAGATRCGAGRCDVRWSDCSSNERPALFALWPDPDLRQRCARASTGSRPRSRASSSVPTSGTSRSSSWAGTGRTAAFVAGRRGSCAPFARRDRVRSGRALAQAAGRVPGGESCANGARNARHAVARGARAGRLRGRARPFRPHVTLARKVRSAAATRLDRRSCGGPTALRSCAP